MLDSKTMTKSPLFPWQERQWQAIERLLDNGRLPHALLLSGPAEMGKKAFAMALVARLLCASPGAGRACGICKSCTLINGDVHPDFYLLEPEDMGKSISVASIREVTSFAAKTALLGAWRAVLVAPAEAMTLSAANALLKTLEEPGNNTLLVLVHHQQGDLLATISSRCQSLLFPVPASVIALEWLEANCKADNYSALLAAADGRPLRAARIAGDGSYSQIKKIESVLTAVAQGLQAPVDAAEQCKEFLPAELVDRILIHHTQTIRNCVQTHGVPTRGHFAFMDQLLIARKRLASKTNPNPQMLIEELLMSWRQLQPTFSA